MGRYATPNGIALHLMCCHVILLLLIIYGCMCVYIYILFFVQRETTQCEEFFNLSFENMEKLLCRDSLYVRSEEDVLQGLVRWCLSDWDHRSCFLPDLINRCVRVSLLSDRSLYPKLDGSNRDAVDLVMTAVNAKRQLCSVDVPRGCVQCLVVCGGQSLHGLVLLVNCTPVYFTVEFQCESMITGHFIYSRSVSFCLDSSIVSL